MTSQLNLFHKATNSAPLIKEVAGLLLLRDYISTQQEKSLIQHIDNTPWSNELKRRVQHYGYKYDYKKRKIDETMRIGSLPPWAKKLAARLYEDGHFDALPDQVIVNEYEVGQGISPHVDCEPCFGDVIVSISLNSTATMVFESLKTKEKVPVFLPQRSAVVLKGDSRYEWKHSIPARKIDKHNNKVHHRNRRISLTFRKVILNP